MNHVIREMQASEYKLLDEFLYYAIFIPQGITPPPKSIIEKDELQVYVKDFGGNKDDRAMVAEVDGKIVGAVWTRIMRDYGHIDDKTPSLAISVRKEYRGKGIGTELMQHILSLLQNCGYESVSLSVQKANYAVKMYEKAGFHVIDENAEEYIMLHELVP